MPACVLDASAALAALVPSQATDTGRAFLSRLPDELIAPDVFRLETRNAIIRLERRGVLPEGHGETGLRLIEALISFGGALSDADLQRASDLARQSGLSFYDAVYLDLARERDAQLATRDGELVNAAQKIGVAVIDLR